MTERPDWRRGQTRPARPQGEQADEALSGDLDELALPPQTEGIGLRRLHLFDSRVSGVHVDLSDVSLHVEWSELDGCRFTQRVRPVLNEHGFAAQGSFGIAPSVYRGCTFERVRFKTLGGFTTGRATFEDCTFVSCRWEGHFAHSAWWVGNRFTGKMNGCVWFGRDDDGRPNIVTGNDFSGAVLTTNVGFRDDYPSDHQTWPEGFAPRERS